MIIDMPCIRISTYTAQYANSLRLMKTLLTLLFLTAGFGALAQRSSYSKEVTTDGRELRIRVDIEQPNRVVRFSRSFDVSAMSASAVRDLERSVLDSLDQANDGRYAGVFNERKREPRSSKAKKQDCSEQVAYAAQVDAEDQVASTNPEVALLEAKSTKTLSPNDVPPSSVLFREDKENGRLWMQYTFRKDGDELVFERTVNVIGKSEREKQAIIKETERSLGIKSVNQ
ncbi:hypothetical protein DYU11_32685 [Fibrisoma montanum]|uniref:Uncharacterized protein n=2 Tax=Fibrisoma montanum TaxID=2305895 RepID=A0A418LVK2_9BACT|nr:hypothetical protein DYU11_32685 [Fibrisoma montanum]